MAPIPLPHSDVTFPSPFSKSRIRGWGPTTSTYSIGLGERHCLPLTWCTERVWQAGWPWTSHASLLSLISSYVKWGNARDSELFSFLPILGHLPSVICFPVRLFTASLQRVSATQVLHHWGLLTSALGTGAWVLDEPESLGSGACGVGEGDKSKKIQMLGNYRSIVCFFFLR